MNVSSVINTSIQIEMLRVRLSVTASTDGVGSKRMNVILPFARNAQPMKRRPMYGSDNQYQLGLVRLKGDFVTNVETMKSFKWARRTRRGTLVLLAFRMR